jgi:hypothetical protein
VINSKKQSWQYTGTLKPKKLRFNGERRQTMGDKGGRKDKEKSQKQNAKKQQETSKKKFDKQPKRTPNK